MRVDSARAARPRSLASPGSGMAAVAILGGGPLLLWPALLNGYPILFSDSAAFLSQTLDRFAAFDKPIVYGPFLHLFHWGVTLWGPALAQALILSHLLWLVQRVVAGEARAGRHLLLLAGLAAGTALPWVASLLMPDFLAPVTVLALFLLGFGWPGLGRAERLHVTALAVIAIASHLSHLIPAAALLALTALLARRVQPVLRVAMPLALALALVIGGNYLAFGRAAVSPHGAVFALARLVADGPAAELIRARCPDAGWHVCGWADRLLTDSDIFLWHPQGPLWAMPDGTPRPGGAIALAPEAGLVVRETLLAHPGAVALAALRNGWRQLFLAGLGDTLRRSDIGSGPAERLARHFPPAEAARFHASRHSADMLSAMAAPLRWPHGVVLALGGMAGLLAWWRAAISGDATLLALVLCVLVGVTANAFATGALSGPHERYQARIAWLLPLVGVLGFWAPSPARPPRRADR